MLKKTLKITMPIDSANLFNALIHNGNSTENRLMLDTKAARESYNDGIVDNITSKVGRPVRSLTLRTQ